MNTSEVLEAIDELEAQKQAILGGIWVRGNPTAESHACAVMRWRHVLGAVALRATTWSMAEAKPKDLRISRKWPERPDIRLRYYCAAWNDCRASGPSEVIDRLERAQQLLKELL